MDNLLELIKVRRSIRKYGESAVSEENIKTLLKSALMAPSSKRSTPWEFIVVDDKDLLSKLSTCKDSGAKFLSAAPLGIVVTADPAVTDTWVEDASVAATHLLLEAEDLGLGACWIQIDKRFDENNIPAADNVRTILDIPENINVLCIIAIGEKGEEKKPFMEEKIKWGKIHYSKY